MNHDYFNEHQAGDMSNKQGGRTVSDRRGRGQCGGEGCIPQIPEGVDVFIILTWRPPQLI